MEIHLSEKIENYIFRNILDAVDVAVTVIDCQGTNVFYNKAASKIEGLKPEEVIGKHLLDVYPSLNESNSSLLKVLKTKWPVINQQQTLVTNTGNKITTIYSTYPLYKNGELIGAFDISRDITEIKNLSERVVDLQAKLLNNKRRYKFSNRSELKETSFTLDDIIGETEDMLKLKNLIQRVAHSPSPILIYGETGTGKEVVVQAIHIEGAREGLVEKPFVAQNCAALPASLLESILMGTVKGSFTGSEDRPGLFEIADGGTLLLDEINSMPLELQSKLLRVLQEGSFRRVGDTKIRYARPRIIACTNVDPHEAVQNKKLREDLYYRLNVISLYIPPLRDRKEDIPLFVDSFLKKFNDKFHINVKGVKEDVMSMFNSYHWPGNVRELQHCLEHAVNVMSGDYIRKEDLPTYLIKQLEGKKKSLFENIIKENDMSLYDSLPEKIAFIERKIIKNALEQTNWNITQTAKTLKIPRQTLQYKIRTLKLVNNGENI